MRLSAPCSRASVALSSPMTPAAARPASQADAKTWWTPAGVARRRSRCPAQTGQLTSSKSISAILHLNRASMQLMSGVGDQTLASALQSACPTISGRAWPALARWQNPAALNSAETSVAGPRENCARHRSASRPGRLPLVATGASTAQRWFKCGNSRLAVIYTIYTRHNCPQPLMCEYTERL